MYNKRQNDTFLGFLKTEKHFLCVFFAFLLFVFTVLKGELNPLYTADVWSRQSRGIYKLFDGSNVDGIYARGIDVSHWQGEIDWEQVAKDDVSFVMVGTGYPDKPDPKFRYNAKEASKAGIALGVYIYSYATNVAEAEAEADYVLDLIKDYPISYPVAYDIEDENAHGNLSKEELSAIILAFTEKIKDAGYHPMLYASDYWFSTKFNLDDLKNLDIWVARYHKLHKYDKPAMWQATSQGSIKGIQGRVDINFQYKDFSNIIAKDISRNIGGKTYHYKNYVLQNSTAAPSADSSSSSGPGASAGSAAKDKQTSGDSKASTSPMKASPPREDTAKGWIQKSGDWYYFDQNTGNAVKSWALISDKWYYFDQSGKMKTGWIKDKDTWYYLNENGDMKTGWVFADSYWYFLNPSGKMKTDWIFTDSKWYYLNASGQMQTGLITLAGNKYYLELDGHMLYDTVLELEGVQYKIDTEGVLHEIRQSDTALTEAPQ